MHTVNDVMLLLSPENMNEMSKVRNILLKVFAEDSFLGVIKILKKQNKFDRASDA